MCSGGGAWQRAGRVRVGAGGRQARPPGGCGRVGAGASGAAARRVRVRVRVRVRAGSRQDDGRRSASSRARKKTQRCQACRGDINRLAFERYRSLSYSIIVPYSSLVIIYKRIADSAGDVDRLGDIDRP